ncbi:MAG: 4Fe-4S dicluster domain-containing protein [Syntrophomonadaceae bacterium]|nr:4Fe-4S dicluster domain-containing protein [Syntrophomonadaceae bacterium]
MRVICGILVLFWAAGIINHSVSGKGLSIVEKAVKLIPACAEDQDLIGRLEADAGTNVNLCYQCGKCTAGCPAAFAMDYPPRQIIRLLQLGMVKPALQAESIWICATCETCSTRCPRGVDIASLMDALRREALRQGQTDKKVAAFNQAFLNCVKLFGRTYEAGILLQHNLKTGQPFKDAQYGLPMMKRGKVGVLPTRIKNRDEIKKIFERAQELGGE